MSVSVLYFYKNYKSFLVWLNIFGSKRRKVLIKAKKKGFKSEKKKVFATDQGNKKVIKGPF